MSCSEKLDRANSFLQKNPRIVIGACAGAVLVVCFVVAIIFFPSAEKSDAWKTTQAVYLQQKQENVAELPAWSVYEQVQDNVGVSGVA